MQEIWVIPYCVPHQIIGDMSPHPCHTGFDAYANNNLSIIYVCLNG